MTSASSLDPYDLISKLKLGFEKLFEHPQTTKSFCILSLYIVQTSLFERHRYILRFKVTGIILTQFGYVLRFIYESFEHSKHLKLQISLNCHYFTARKLL